MFSFQKKKKKKNWAKKTLVFISQKAKQKLFSQLQMCLKKDKIMPRAYFCWMVSLALGFCWMVSLAPDFCWMVSLAPGFCWMVSLAPGFCWMVSLAPGLVSYQLILTIFQSMLIMHCLPSTINCLNTPETNSSKTFSAFQLCA